MHACMHCSPGSARRCCCDALGGGAGGDVGGQGQGKGGKRLDMQLEEQGQVQVISTHVYFSDARSRRAELSYHALASSLATSQRPDRVLRLKCQRTIHLLSRMIHVFWERVQGD